MNPNRMVVSPSVTVDLARNFFRVFHDCVEVMSEGAACSAINCWKNKRKTPDLSFFTFPRDEERCRQWIQNMGRAKFTVGDAKYCHLCSQHFADSQFINASKKELIWNAVPTIFGFADLPHEEKPSRYGIVYPPSKRRKIFAAEPSTKFERREIECPEPEVRIRQEPIVPDGEYRVSSFQHNSVSNQEDLLLRDIVPQLEHRSDEDDEIPQQEDVSKQDDRVMMQDVHLDKINAVPAIFDFADIPHEEWKLNQYGIAYPPRKRRKIFAPEPITKIRSEIECPVSEIRIKPEPVVPDQERKISSFQHKNVSDQEAIVPKQECLPLFIRVPKLEYFSDQDEVPEQQDEIPQQEDVSKQGDAVMMQNLDLDNIKEEPLFVEDELCSNEELYEPAFVSVEERNMAATYCEAKLSEDECELERAVDLASESLEQEDPFSATQDQFQVLPEILPSTENNNDLLDDMPLLKRCPNAVARSHTPSENRTPVSPRSQWQLKGPAKLMQEKEMSADLYVPPPKRGSIEWAQHVSKNIEEHILAVRQEKLLKETMEEGRTRSSKTETSVPPRNADAPRLATWNDRRSLACPQCQMVLESFASFQKHHCKFMDPTISCTVKVETPYACLCREVFESYAKCAQHVSRCPTMSVAWNGDKPYPCTFCGESFSSTRIQSAHRNTCLRNKLHQCYSCDRRFHDPDMRTIHVRLIHGEGRVCFDCGMYCDSDEGLKAHIQIRQCRFIVIYPCEYCGRMFCDIESQRNHLLIHISDKTNNCSEESVQTKPSNEALPTNEKQMTGLVHGGDITDNSSKEDQPKPSEDPSSTNEELKQMLVQRCDQQDNLAQENTTTLGVYPEPISFSSPVIVKQKKMLIHTADKRENWAEEGIQTEPTKNPSPANMKPSKVFIHSGDKTENGSEDHIQPKPAKDPYVNLKKLVECIRNKLQGGRRQTGHSSRTHKKSVTC